MATIAKKQIAILTCVLIWHTASSFDDVAGDEDLQLDDAAFPVGDKGEVVHRPGIEDIIEDESVPDATTTAVPESNPTEGDEKPSGKTTKVPFLANEYFAEDFENSELAAGIDREIDQKFTNISVGVSNAARRINSYHSRGVLHSILQCLKKLKIATLPENGNPFILHIRKYVARVYDVAKSHISSGADPKNKEQLYNDILNDPASGIGEPDMAMQWREQTKPFHFLLIQYQNVVDQIVEAKRKAKHAEIQSHAPELLAFYNDGSYLLQEAHFAFLNHNIGIGEFSDQIAEFAGKFLQLQDIMRDYDIFNLAVDWNVSGGKSKTSKNRKRKCKKGKKGRQCRKNNKKKKQY